MPIFRINDQLHYYAHVPKTGGSSVEHYLVSRFGRIGFMNGLYGHSPKAQRWTKTSPQHVCWRDFNQLIPKDWLTSSFSVVRDPVRRLLSAYYFQKEKLRNIPQDRSFDDWFRLRLPKLREGNFFDDNHLVPQSRIVPPAATFFRLEDGLDQVVDHLDALEGLERGPRQIEAKNLRHGTKELVLSDDMLTLIGEVYAQDFKRFGYTLPI